MSHRLDVLKKEIEVLEMIKAFQIKIKNVLPTKYRGFYIHGSLALGDFRMHASDVDFMILLTEDLDDTETDHITKVHETIRKEYPIWGHRLEGSYLPIEVLEAVEPPLFERLYVNGDTVTRAKYGYEWLFEKFVLREQAIVIDGDAFDTFTSPIDHKDLLIASKELYKREWLPEISEVVRLKNQDYQIFGLLTIVRLLYTVKHESVASKTDAVNWFVLEYPEYALIMESALGWKRGDKIDLLKETKQLIEMSKSELLE